MPLLFKARSSNFADREIVPKPELALCAWVTAPSNMDSSTGFLRCWLITL